MSRVCYAVTRVITLKIYDFIYLPNNRELLAIKENIYNIAGMPNVVETIHCTHKN